MNAKELQDKATAIREALEKKMNPSASNYKEYGDAQRAADKQEKEQKTQTDNNSKSKI